MPVILAKSAGFCFGVSRAVARVEELLAAGEQVCTLGPIIHNPQVVGQLAARGVTIADRPEDTPAGAVLVIRSHGVPENVYDRLRTLGIRYSDATCPFVEKIHRIVAEQSAAGRTVLIAGDPDHPEVLGIRGHCRGDVFVFRDVQELQAIFSNDHNPQKDPSLWSRKLPLIQTCGKSAQISQKKTVQIS